MALNPEWAVELARALQRQRSQLDSPCDVIISIEGYQIRAHRSVLAASNCHKLIDLLRKTNQIELSNLPVAGVVSFFDYLYTGQIGSELIYQVANYFHYAIHGGQLAQLDLQQHSTEPSINRTTSTNTNNCIIDYFDKEDLFDLLPPNDHINNHLHNNHHSLNETMLEIGRNRTTVVTPTVSLSDEYGYSNKSPSLEFVDDLTQIEATLTTITTTTSAETNSTTESASSAQNNHEITQQTTQGTKWCDQCQRTFVSERDYAAHVKRAHKTTSIKCAQCNKGFASRKTLSRHTAICQKPKPTKPSTPNTTTTTIKPRLACTHCELTFSKKSNLNDHIRRKHTDKSMVRMHQCDKCAKQFTRANDLRVHMKWHLNIRDYKCQMCSECFVTNGALELHLKRHHDDRRYACDICPERFIHAGALKKHRATHDTHSNLLCSACGIHLNCQAALVTHMREAHPETQ